MNLHYPHIYLYSIWTAFFSPLSIRFCDLWNQVASSHPALWEHYSSAIGDLTSQSFTSSGTNLIQDFLIILIIISHYSQEILHILVIICSLILWTPATTVFSRSQVSFHALLFIFLPYVQGLSRTYCSFCHKIKSFLSFLKKIK